MVTISEFAQTHNLQVKDILEVAQNLGLKFQSGSDILSDLAKKELMNALNQHRKGLALKDIKKVFSLNSGNGKGSITVVTKTRKDVKPFDLQALKTKTKKTEPVESIQPSETQDVTQIANSQNSQLVLEEQPVLQQEKQKEHVDITHVESARVVTPIEELIDEDLALNVVDVVAPVVSPSKNQEEDKNTHHRGSISPKAISTDDEDHSSTRSTKSKSKKKKSSAQGQVDIAKLDNHALKKLTAQLQYHEAADEEIDSFSNKKMKASVRKNLHQFHKPVKPASLVVELPDQISVTDLAGKMSLKIIVVIKELLKLGVVAQPNTVIDRDTATLVVEELGHKATTFVEQNPEDRLVIEYTSSLEPRSPVVTIMGHVDHGKTSLLDSIRRSRVAASEAGGITQHIGAYRVETQHGSVTFLDTPGHAAFTAMRARGAQCTDIAVILVAADDGVMPQTKEAVSHAQAAGVPIVVAINKVDKPGVDVERVKTEMAQLNVLPEEWGGDSPFMPISAKTGQGVQELLDALALQAEILELKAHREGPAQGSIIESSLSRHKGPVATLLVQNGTLKIGDLIVCGTSYGRVKAMYDDLGRSLEEAIPSMPVQVMGLSSVVDAGEKFSVIQSEKHAREVIDHRLSQTKRQQSTTSAVNLENFFQADSKKKELNIVLKADTQGSVQAISESLKKLGTDEVAVKILSHGVGGINESDVILAKASSGIIVAFNTRAEKSAKQIAEQDKVAIYYFSIIYELLDQVRSAIYGLESPKFQEEIVGLAEVRSVFRSSVLGAIAGCLVVEGNVRKDLPIRVLRRNVVVFQGKLESLRRYKDDVQEVRAGTECGIGVKDYNDVMEGDQIEVYRMVEVQKKMQSHS